MMEFVVDGAVFKADSQADCWIRPSVSLEPHPPHVWASVSARFGPYFCNGYPPPEPPEGRYLSTRQ